MTFRPSDGVLDDLDSNKSPLIENQSNEGLNDLNQFGWQQDLSQSNDVNWKNDENVWLISWSWVTSGVDEIKSPDLSELLEKGSKKNIWEGFNEATEWEMWNLDIISKWWENDGLSNSVLLEDKQDVKSDSGKEDIYLNSIESNFKNSEGYNLDEDSVSNDGLTDKDRYGIVSKIIGSVHSKLDLLVDSEWDFFVNKYKIIHRIVFRWGVFIVVLILWWVLWVMAQVYGNQPLNESYIIGDSSIENKSEWIEETSKDLLSGLVDENIEVLIPYWFASVDDSNKSFQSKSNLILYSWIILPQLAYVDLNLYDFISLEKFENRETTREDINNMVKYLITNDLIYNKTSVIPKILDTRRVWKTFEWSLIEWFNLNCLDKDKVSDIVCDKFLNIFYKYGKYYDLSRYSSEISVLVRELKRQNKNILPVCNMISEYTLRSWETSSILNSIMSNCNSDLWQSYKDLVDFINIENSLMWSRISDISENPYLNAYKLLTIQQMVYRNLNMSSSVNEDLIKNYLSFLQGLINKDKWSGRYLPSIYKDISYVFNTYELYQKLIQKWQLSAELRSQISQINNGNYLMGDLSLVSQLTTPDIAELSWESLTWNIEEKTLDELFSQYYSMTDRLKIRRKTELSDVDIQVQAEIYSNEVLKVTWWETLKATFMLVRRENTLYVKNINISWQPDLSNILNSNASDWTLTFNAILGIINEQIWYWYKDPLWEAVIKTTLCEWLQLRDDIDVYTCDDTSIVLYKWDVEYTFVLVNWVLESFNISDPDLNSSVKDVFWSVLTSKDTTPTIIDSIIGFKKEIITHDNVEKKLEVINQFRIHFKVVPTIFDVEWEENIFLVNFLLWDVELQWYYNLDTHLLNKISYVACGKTLDIRNLEIKITTENESQLVKILNNPRVFLSNVNEGAYKKYQRMCN